MEIRRLIRPSPTSGKDDDDKWIHKDDYHRKQGSLKCRHCWRWRRLLRASPITQCILGLLTLGALVAYVVFTARALLYSRPPWIYGRPTSHNDVQKCLLQSTSTQELIYSNNARLAYWEHYNFSSTSTTPSKAQRRLLIAQYSGYGAYAAMLDLVAPVNAQYAQFWGHDFVVLQGTAMEFVGISPSCDNDARATFNKIPLLEYALQQKHRYDQLLILDTDAMIVNFQVDLTTLLDSTNFLAAHRVTAWDWTANTWDVNAGITLWNLQHPQMPGVVQEWKRLVLDNPELVVERNDDQYFLQSCLLNMGYWQRAVQSLTREFNYYQATHIKHFKRDKRSWSTTSLEQRLLRIQESIAQLDCGERETLTFKCQYPLKTRFAQRTRPES